MTATTLAERISTLIDEAATAKKLKRSQVIGEIAKALNIREPSIYDWLNGTTKRLQGMNLLNCAQFFSVNPTWLDSGRGPRTVATEIRQDTASYATENSSFVLIAELQNEIAAGNGSTLLEYDEVAGHRAYRRDWIAKHGYSINALKLLTVCGDSMEPYLFDGNKVLVNTADRRIIDGEHYALRIGDTLKVKRLFTQGDGKIRVESYNAPVDYLSPLDDAEILGLVVDRNGTSTRRR